MGINNAIFEAPYIFCKQLFTQQIIESVEIYNNIA